MHASLDYPLPSQPKKKKKGGKKGSIELYYRYNAKRARQTDCEEGCLIKLKNCRHSRGSKRKKNKQEAKREGSVKFDRTAKDIERKRGEAAAVRLLVW